MTRELEAALEAADASRQVIRGHVAKGFTVDWKPDRSEVTAADREAEQAIRQVLRHAFPDHGITGEEFGSGGAEQEWNWLIDPIDGTSSFVHGLPFYSTLIALSHRGEPVLAVIDFPGLGRRLHAEAGGGAWEGHNRLHVSPGFDAHASLVAHGDRYQFEAADRMQLYERLSGELRLFRSYTDAHGHALVALGSAALMVDPDLKPWDVAAPSLLVREAGGQVLLMPDTDPGRVTAVAGTAEAVAWVQSLSSGSSSYTGPNGR